ncbi:hypothetical protein A2395_04505 [Candidatus Amesbacteria bacterium RIFOXYB1_FULL_47_9]|uniref:Uncharacterized protein n=3 Tax=Candidatus Amesiibacteriota TaxID=1752730 RepID=A0A1F4ZYT1_9BACT|nr:MAG: hypothetical protein A2395_04505 [Candidatus Amesbacteria bacterium RIFOXYB1_FULL_47_9]
MKIEKDKITFTNPNIEAVRKMVEETDKRLLRGSGFSEEDLHIMFINHQALEDMENGNKTNVVFYNEDGTIRRI